MTRSGMRLPVSNGLREVEFPTLEESNVEPPNPAYLNVHASFAKSSASFWHCRVHCERRTGC